MSALAVLSFLACTSTHQSAPAPSPDGLCALETPESWSGCDGQQVQLTGAVPEMVYNHPMMNGPASEQTYLDIEGVGQIIVITTAPQVCSGEMTVTGQLQRIDMGGEPGTRGSYTGWVIQGAEIVCRR